MVLLLSLCGVDLSMKHPVEGGITKRSPRSQGGQTNENGVGAVSFMSPCKENKVKKRRNGKSIEKKGGCEIADRPSDEVVDQGEGDGIVTRRRLKIKEITTEELVGADLTDRKNKKKYPCLGNQPEWRRQWQPSVINQYPTAKIQMKMLGETHLNSS
ncbi:hypothetical protein vseg_017708 [Gypsophila vaccaria]